MFQNILKIILFIWIVLVILGAFLYAPTAKGLGEFTRVLFFHVPMAWITVLAFLLSALNQKLVQMLQEEGQVYLSSTTINGEFTIRLAALSFRTHLEDIERTLDVLVQLSQRLLDS